MRDERKRLLLLPVRRHLMSVTLAYLAGVYLAPHFAVHVLYAGIFCAFLLALAAWLARRRRSALFCLMGVFLLLGNARTGWELALRDAPTGSKVMMEGTISAIEKEYRVVLQDVIVGGEKTLHRNAVVSLLLDDKAEVKPDMPKVGQRISGLGRLFAPEEPRNPGGSNRRYAALADGYDLSGYLLHGWQAEGKAVFSLREMFRCVREAFLHQSEEIFGEKAALYQGIMLGDKSALNAQLKSSMQLTGTAHVLTVSGLHLSMIALALSALLEKAALSRRSRFFLLGLFLSVFTALTGGAAGTVRAMIMALMRELAKARSRQYEPLTSLSFAALLMTLYRPVWALDASFQFSFFVVLGIILLAGGVDLLRAKRAQTLSRVRSVLRSLWALIGVSFCAQTAALPMQLLLYGYVPLLSLPMNAFCSLLMPPMMLLGWAGTLLAFASSSLGALAGWCGMRLASLFESVSLWAASLPFAIIRLPSPYGVSVFLFAVLMMLLSIRIRFGERRRAAVWMIAAAMSLSYVPRFCAGNGYVQLDVGQGDAALFRQGRHAVVIDVGPEDSYDLLRYLRHEGLLVDAVILSHPDQDHAGAMKMLLDSEIAVENIIVAKGALHQKTTEGVKAAFDQIKAERISVREVSSGDELDFGALHMRVLSPDDALSGDNERSLVLHAELEDVHFLLTGDLPLESEPENLPYADVLKVAHHGSKNATSEKLLASVQPKAALISVGEGNWYKHPSPVLLDRLEAANAEILRTDKQGCITLWLRDGSFWAECFLNPS